MYELWFRNSYEDELKNCLMTAAIRPGNRKHPHSKGTRVNEDVLIRVIEIPGSEAEGTLPEFTDFQCNARITKLDVKTISELTLEDLENCSTDSRTIDQVKNQLQRIYGKDFSDQDEVTVVHWEYI